MDLDQIKTEASKDLIIVNEEQLGSESLKNQKIKAKYLDYKSRFELLLAKEKQITHMEAVLYYCNKEGIEPDTVGYLISKGLKEKIEANARALNFLPKQAQLPV